MTKSNACKQWRWSMVFFWLQIAIATASPTPIEIAPGTHYWAVKDRLQYIVDEHSAATIDSLLDGSASAQWHEVTSAIPNFGYDKRPYWYRLSLRLKTGESAPFILQVDHPLLDFLDVYYVREGRIIDRYYTGDMLPFAQRPIANRNFLFPLSLNDKTPLEIYLRVQTDSPQSLPLTLWNPEQLDQQDRKILMWHSFYFGIVFVMIFYNLSMFFSVKDINYFFYVSSITFFALFYASMNGYTFQHWWPNSIHWNDKGPMLFLNLFILFRAFFVFNFLNLHSLGKWLVLFHRGFLFMAVLSLISVFVAPISIAIKIGLTIGMIGLLLGLIEGALSWSRGEQHARFFVSGWAIFMACLLIQLFTNIGIIVTNTFTILATQIGSTIEIILFTFALAVRVRSVHRERDALEQQAKTALVDVNRSLEESLRVKNEFLATISHELRTPMNGVFASFDIIAHSNNMDEIHRLCNIGNQSAREMMGMIEGILGYTEMQSGQFELEQVEFSLSKLCNERYKEFYKRAAASNLTFDLNVDPALPDRLIGDHRRISQVLNCLLDNAIKFTPQGGVSLSVTGNIREAEDENNIDQLDIHFCVADSGIGVSREDSQRIFQKFSQVDSSYHRSYGGLGLGLAISQSLVDAMGGKLVYEPVVEGGSRFTVSLTCACLANRRKLSGDRNDFSVSTSTRVLIVEDNKVNQMVMTSLVTKMGAAALVAENGAEAVSLVQEQLVHLILMDLQMPIMDGFEATQKIRDMNLPVSQVPIIAVTANVMDSDRKRCRECGMDDFISKPVKREQLNDVFARWLREPPASQ